MTNLVTFIQLEHVLAELGFHKRVVPREAVVYDHSAAHPLIVSLHKPKEMVPDYVLAYVRQQLDAQGIVERADFEGMLQAVAA